MLYQVSQSQVRNEFYEMVYTLRIEDVFVKLKRMGKDFIKDQQKDPV